MKNLTIYILLLFLLINKANASIEPEVYFGGKMMFNYGMADQSAAYQQDYLPIDYSNSTNYNNLNDDIYYTHDSYIDFLAIGKEDNGFLYGGAMTLQFDSQRDYNYSYSTSGELSYSDSTPNVGVRRSYMFLEKERFGRFEFGDGEGPSKKMKFDPTYKFGGTGGIAGNWWKYINVPDFYLTYSNDYDTTETSDVQYSSGSGNKGFIIRPDLPLSHGYTPEFGAYKIDDTRTLARVSYYTPRISNIQFGISYAPDSGQRGSSYYGNGFSDNGDVINIIDWGLNYVQQFSNDFGIAMSYTGEIGYAEDTEVMTSGYFYQQDLFAHAIGFYGFKGNFNYSASIGMWGDSLMFVNNSLATSSSEYRDSDASYTSYGFGYQFGAYKVSFASLTSSYRQQDFTLNSIAFDYHMSKNLTVYAEINDYNFDVFSSDEASSYSSLSVTESIDNAGSVIFLGIKMNFGGFDNPSSILLDTSANNY